MRQVSSYYLFYSEEQAMAPIDKSDPRNAHMVQNHMIVCDASNALV